MWRAQVVQLKEDGMNAPFRFRKTSGVHSFALIYAQLANYMPLLSRARLPATDARVHALLCRRPVHGMVHSGSCIRTRSCRLTSGPTH